jgi:hypothetical protein
MNRRRFSVGLAAAGILLAAGPASAAEGPSTVRIGFQKSSTLIGILKANGELEKALATLGVSVTWSTDWPAAAGSPERRSRRYFRRRRGYRACLHTVEALIWSPNKQASAN